MSLKFLLIEQAKMVNSILLYSSFSWMLVRT